MKSRRLCIKLTLIACSMAFVVCSSAQVLNNKLNIYMGYSIGQAETEQYVGNGSFQFPSLFASQKFKSISFQGIYNVNKFISTGVRIEVMNGSDHGLTWNAIYRGAATSFVFLSPVIQVQNPFQESGILNRLKLFLNIQPIFGRARIDIQTPLSDIQYEGIEIFETGLSSKTDTFGLSGTGGIEFSLIQQAGINFSYSFVHHWLQSSLCMDTDFTLSKFEMGIYYRFLKNKRYYY